MHGHSRIVCRPVLRRLGAIVAALGLWVIAMGVVDAHAPDPTVGGKLWAQDQDVGYAWRAGQAPDAWLATAIDAAAASSNATRASRSARFTYRPGSASLIAYGEPTNCGPAGIACFDRSGAPTSFRMWFRRHGTWFDWGQLRWCEAPGGSADGCFEAQTIALDELGHVEILGHHVNHPDERDYLDAVVQTLSRAKSRPGWSSRSYGVCDVARLQLEYDMSSWSAPYSTCLDLATSATLAAGRSTITLGETVIFSATLKVATSSSYRKLSGNPVSGRAMRLQRRLVGATEWTTIVTMSGGSSAGIYVANVTPSATADWRVVGAPSGEGLRPATSALVRLTVSSCSGSPCPQRAQP
jgi:hypothetical protein